MVLSRMLVVRQQKRKDEDMVGKAKTVGQLLAAVLKANPGETMEVTWDGDEYIVDFGENTEIGPKLYGAFKSIGKASLAAQDSAVARLRARVGL